MAGAFAFTLELAQPSCSEIRVFAAALHTCCGCCGPCRKALPAPSSGERL